MGYVHHAINEYQLRLDVQRFLWPAYYIILRGSFTLHLRDDVQHCSKLLWGILNSKCSHPHYSYSNVSFVGTDSSMPSILTLDLHCACGQYEVSYS